MIGNPIFIDMMNALGGNGVAMGYDQVFSALQTGVIDGAENNPPSYVFSNHYTAAKYYSLTEHLIIPEVLMFSKKAWSNLSADDQGLIRKFARKATGAARTIRDGDSVEILRDQALDDHAIAPHAVELAVLLVHADLLEAHVRHEGEAGAVLGKDARDEFPHAPGAHEPALEVA